MFAVMYGVPNDLTECTCLGSIVWLVTCSLTHMVASAVTKGFVQCLHHVQERQQQNVSHDHHAER